MRKHWFFSVLKTNWANMVGNKKAFWLLMFGMCAQNMIFFMSWVILFSRISSLRGWQLPDIGMLFGSTCISYGIIFTIFGGISELNQTIQNSSLDMCLARPRSTLLLAVAQRMNPANMGDIITGTIIISVFVKPELYMLPLILLLSVTSGLVFLAFRLSMHCLAFWGTGGETGENGFTAFIITATNPQKGFSTALKFFVLTIFPAGYIGWLPVEIVRHFRWDYLLLQVSGSMVLCVVAWWIFQQGLKRYSSGNKFLLLR